MVPSSSGRMADSQSAHIGSNPVGTIFNKGVDGSWETRGAVNALSMTC